MVTKAEPKPKKSLLSGDRIGTHLVLGLSTIVGCQIALFYDPSDIIAEPLSLGLGYVSLVYMVVSLLIGPLYLARQRRNPVNLYLRRDVGIWAGITALLHVFFSLKLYVGGQVLLYFFRQSGSHYLPQLDLFGLSNYVGLLAAVIILVLLVLSNNRSMRWLKGKRWKRIQQLTYPLIVLTILHTLGYQLYNERDGLLPGVLGVLTLIVALAQGTGVLVHRRREQVRGQRQKRPQAEGTVPHLAEPSPQSSVPLAPDGVSRRRFLVVGGATLLAGITALTFKATEEIFRPTNPLPSGTTTSTLPAVDNAQVPSPTAAVVAENPAAPPTAPAVAENPPTLEPAPPAAPPENPTATDTNPVATDTPAPVPTSTVAEANGGVVLTTVADCPANSSLTFTTPDTGETAILVHEADGTVKAFSNVCTHRPYPVVYDANSQLLVCPLHRACFNANTGRVTQGPARRALASMQVHVDSKGNIVYG